jgi:hypothetical protein
VQGEQRERLVALAAKAAVERSPAKFHALVLEINKLLHDPSLAPGLNPKDPRESTN